MRCADVYVRDWMVWFRKDGCDSEGRIVIARRGHKQKAKRDVLDEFHFRLCRAEEV